MILLQIDALSETVLNFSIQDLLKGDTTALIPILYLIISVAIYSIMIWHFYRYVARRDCFLITNNKHPCVTSFCKYFFIFPLVAFLFFAGFSTMLLFLTKSYSLEVILSTSFGLIVAIRLTAYYSEDLSKDVAKMLPFALLGIVLVDPSYFSVESILLKFQQLPQFFSQIIQYIIVIIFVEWVLRSTLGIKIWIMTSKNHTSKKSNVPITS